MRPGEAAEMHLKRVDLNVVALSQLLDLGIREETRERNARRDGIVPVATLPISQARLKLR
jgi:hypothetical protein